MTGRPTPAPVIVAVGPELLKDVSTIIPTGLSPQALNKQITDDLAYLEPRMRAGRNLSDEEYSYLAWIDLRLGVIGRHSSSPGYASQVVTSDLVLAKALRWMADSEKIPADKRRIQLHDVAGRILSPNGGSILELDTGNSTSAREAYIELVNRVAERVDPHVRVVALTRDRELERYMYKRGPVQILPTQRWRSFSLPKAELAASPVLRPAQSRGDESQAVLRNTRTTGTSGIPRLALEPLRGRGPRRGR